MQLLSTWGDRHYGGLAALEMYDMDGVLITPLTHDMGFEAIVESINVLEGSSGTDVRTTPAADSSLSPLCRTPRSGKYPGSRCMSR